MSAPGAVYIGRRINGKDVVQAFEVGNKTIFFKGVRGLVIGFTYEYSGDGTISVTPKRLSVPEKSNAEWEARDALAENHQAERRAEARMKRLSRPTYRNAVDSFRPLIKGLNLYERLALTRKIIDDAAR